MRKLLLILLSSITLVANDLFLYEYSGQPEISEVVSNKSIIVDNIKGKTYTLENNLSVSTDTNSTATYIFPHRIAILQKESTGGYFTDGDVTYVNDFKLSEILKIKESQFVQSFNGELYCVSESTNQSTIGTSMANILFDQAKLFIKSGDKYTHVYVIEGKCTVLDTKSSKKKKELKQNDYLVVTPQVILSPREGSVKSNGNSFSIKEVDEEEIVIHKKQIDELQIKLNNTLFVNYNTNIFGFKLRTP